MDLLIQYIEWKARKQSLRSFSKWLVDSGWEDPSIGNSKTVYIRYGTEFVLKILEKRFFDMQGNNFLRESGTLPGYEFARPETLRVFENNEFVLIFQEKVRAFGYRGVGKYRKSFEILVGKINRNKTPRPFYADLHDQNFGISRRGRAVFFDGI